MLFGYMFFLLFGQQVDHASEGRRNWLLKLGRHEDADGGEVKNLWSGEVLGTNHVDVSVEDAQYNLDRIQTMGIDLDDVAQKLEIEGVASFTKAFHDLLTSLEAKAKNQ